MTQAETLIVTGASSFVGCNLAVFLARNGNKVVGTISQDETSYKGIQDTRLKAARTEEVELARLDLSCKRNLCNFVDEYKPSIWFHHAGWATAYGSFDYDLERGFRINVEPLTILYQALDRAGCKGIIITGTAAEYSDNDNACMEGDSCWPTLPYGLSKLTETVCARQLAHKYGIPTRVVRIFNIYGRMDSPSKLISCVVTALLSSAKIELSACDQRRDFLSIDDLLRGYESLIGDLARTSVFDIFNLCSGQAIPLKELLIKIANALERDTELLLFGARPMRPGEPPVSFGSNTKAERLLGWRPRPIEEGIQQYLNEVAIENDGV